MIEFYRCSNCTTWLQGSKYSCTFSTGCLCQGHRNCVFRVPRRNFQRKAKLGSSLPSAWGYSSLSVGSVGMIFSLDLMTGMVAYQRSASDEWNNSQNTHNHFFVTWYQGNSGSFLYWSSTAGTKMRKVSWRKRREEIKVN